MKTLITSTLVLFSVFICFCLPLFVVTQNRDCVLQLRPTNSSYKFINLNPIDMNGPIEVKNVGDLWSYFINICQPTKQPLPICNIKSQIYQTGLNYLCNPVGVTNTTSLSLIDSTNPMNGVVVNYKVITGGDGIGRTAQINLLCDPKGSSNSTVNLSFEQEVLNENYDIVYIFSGKTIYACPV
ncbi:hypothetical protein ABK040_001325 [Willaertia magna]